MSRPLPQWLVEPPEASDYVKKILKIARERWDHIDAQREEILEAFLAKYHCDPKDCVQVIQTMDDGSQKYFIRQRTPEEQEMLSRMSSQL